MPALIIGGCELPLPKISSISEDPRWVPVPDNGHLNTLQKIQRKKNLAMLCGFSNVSRFQKLQASTFLTSLFSQNMQVFSMIHILPHVHSRISKFCKIGVVNNEFFQVPEQELQSLFLFLCPSFFLVFFSCFRFCWTRSFSVFFFSFRFCWPLWWWHHAEFCHHQ
jgi:hypothetical protein